jgi:hypothetical protein
MRNCGRERIFGQRRRPPPPRAAGSGAPAAAQPRARVARRWIGRGWPRFNRPRVKLGRVLVNQGAFVKDPLGFSLFAGRPSHHQRSLQSSP